MDSVYRQNKSPFAGALGDWFLLRTHFLTSKASPNDSEIVIVVIIIIIGEAQLVFHMGGIIAQTGYFDRVTFSAKGMGIALLVITVIGTTSGILRANWWIAMLVCAILGLA